MEQPDKQLLALAGMITGHASVLPEEVVEYYLSHRDQIPNALRRGFISPCMQPPPEMPPPPTHDVLYQHLFGVMNDAVIELQRCGKAIQPFDCDTIVNMPSSSGFVRPVYVPPKLTVSTLMERLKARLGVRASDCVGNFNLHELPDRMMRTHGWFLVDFGPAPVGSSGEEQIKQWDDYLAGRVALAGYIMYPKLAMYAGKKYKTLDVPPQIVLGLIDGTGRECLMLDQYFDEDVLPSPQLSMTKLDYSSDEPPCGYGMYAVPRIVWPTL